MPQAPGAGEQRVGAGELRVGAGELCPEHGERLQLRCGLDGDPLCPRCVAGDRHRDHPLRPMREVVRLHQKELKASLASLKEKKAVFTGIMSSQERKISALKGAMESLGRHVTEEFATMRRFLEERERGLRRELADYAAGLLQPLEDNLRTIQRALISVQKDISCCQAVVNQWDSRRFLQEFQRLKERPREDLHCPAAVSAEPCLGVFKGPLQYRVWKEMRDCISPVPASLTLDPDTANAWLELEEDLTSAGAAETQREVPDRPGRFHPSPCVLGSQGFRSGRHYWEVEVRDKTEWAVGVARESAPRKGDIALSPRDGFWAIWLRRGADYRALTSPPTRLTPDPRPGRVGVYLDYEGGQVSFYEADRMAHLFTFSAAFSERLFPFFSPGLREGHRNRTPVRVRHLRL